MHYKFVVMQSFLSFNTASDNLKLETEMHSKYKCMTRGMPADRVV